MASLHSSPSWSARIGNFFPLRGGVDGEGRLGDLRAYRWVASNPGGLRPARVNDHTASACYRGHVLLAAHTRGMCDVIMPCGDCPSFNNSIVVPVHSASQGLGHAVESLIGEIPHPKLNLPQYCGSHRNVSSGRREPRHTPCTLFAPCFPSSSNSFPHGTLPFH